MMNNAAPPLVEDDSNFFKNNKAAAEIIPWIFTIILTWGCKKEPEDTYEDFFKKKLPSDKFDKYMNRFKADRSKLRLKNSESFDVTFMYKLIPAACEGFEKVGSTAWTEDDGTKLECCLKKLKDFRNDVSHEPKGAGIRSGLMNNVLTLATKTLELAGSLFSIVLDVVEKSIEDLQRKVKDINDTMMTDKERRMEQVKKRIMIDGRSEMRDKLKEKDRMMSLPFTATKVVSRNVFHMSKLKIGNDVDSEVISSKELFQTITTRYCFIQGQPRSGKSTLLRRMVEDFFEENLTTETFSGIRNYAFMLFFECRDRVMSNCFNLVQQAIPNTLENLKQDEALEILRKLPCLLLIDGIDEITKNSRLVLEDLISNFGAQDKSTFVLTSRPGDEMEKMKRELFTKGVDYSVAFIEPIIDRNEQIQFLERFANSIPGIAPENLTNAFTSLTQSCFVHFEYPLYLALFCQLFQSSAHDAGMWENECSIMEQLVNLSITMIEDRLKVQHVPHWKNVSRKLIKAAGKLSLDLLVQDKLTIKMSEYMELCGNWFGNNEVSYETILSCIFLPTSEYDTYEYLHKSQAEYLAARTLLTQLRNNPGHSISKQIKDIGIRKKPSNDSGSATQNVVKRLGSKFVNWATGVFSKSLSEVQQQRFLNVMRFIVMELADDKSQKLLKKCLTELAEITKTIGNEKANIEFWAELSLSCPKSEQVALAATQVVNVSDQGLGEGNWIVTSQREMTTAIFSLRNKTPKKLTVKLSQEAINTPSLMPMIGLMEKYYKNDFELILKQSFFRFLSNDKVLTRLSGSKFKLTQFTGCITSTTAQTALIKAVRLVKDGRVMKISISNTSPRKHKLAVLKGTRHELSFRTKLSETCSVRSHCPLPKGISEPRLTIVLEDSYQSHAELVELIEDLAPVDKKYRHLYLESWIGSDSSLNQVLEALYTSGVRTIYNLHRGAAINWEFIEADMHSCVVCGESNHEKKVGRCVKLFLPLSDSEKSERLAGFRRREDTRKLMKRSAPAQ